MLKSVDWTLIAFLVPLFVMSIFTMSSFTTFETSIALRQLLWVGVSLALIFGVSSLDLRAIRQSNILVLLYGGSIALLVGLFFFGVTRNGATSWYSLGILSFQPADLVKLILIMVLAKYLARRHVEIKAMKHVLITAVYTIIPFILIFLQPDFGSAAILLAIWLGMILVSGMSKKHIIVLFGVTALAGVGLWFGVLQDYQKERVESFLNPLSDIQGAGYNAYQSTVAVGSGQLLGKGIGEGTQSRLAFLPEYETDFIFAAVAEEWGFIGSVLMVLLLLAIVARILYIGYQYGGNFEILFCVGLAMYFLTHIIINVGMNIGLLPVTGVTLPFLSYGGSHLIIESLALAIVMSFKHQSQRVYQSASPEVFLR